MRLSRLALAIMACGLASHSLASGFALSEQSVSALGTANAGRASDVQDASVTYNNPAAMVQLKRAQATGSVSFLDARARISNVTAPLGGTNDGNMVPHTYIPSGHFTSGDQGRWAWGVSAYGSFGLKTNYEPTFAGRHLGDKSSVKVTTLQPAVSFAINDQVRVGAGLTFNKLDALLSKNVSSIPDLNGPAPGTIPGTVLGTTTLEGKDTGYGFNLGIHADLTPATQAGLVYRSKVRYKISDGSLTTTGTGADPDGPGPSGVVGSAGRYNASTSMTTPESVELGLTHALSPKTRLHATTSWTRWSRLQSLVVATDNPLVGTTTENFHWKDSMAYAVGVSHDCSENLTLRGGLAYDNTPVSPADRSVRLPDGDRRIVSIGAGYKLAPNRKIDVAYNWLDMEKAAVRQTAYSADYHGSASIYSLQFTQAF